MKIVVLAKPSAKEDKLERVDQPALLNNSKETDIPTYKVWVKAPPVNGKSNTAICKLLADYFKVPVSSVNLLSGRASKRKIFAIEK